MNEIELGKMTVWGNLSTFGSSMATQEEANDVLKALRRNNIAWMSFNVSCFIAVAALRYWRMGEILLIDSPGVCRSELQILSVSLCARCSFIPEEEDTFYADQRRLEQQ